MIPFLQGKKDFSGAALQAPPVKSILPSAGGVARPAPVGPSVEVVKEGDKIVRLVVTCACGERTEVECLYRPGS